MGRFWKENTSKRFQEEKEKDLMRRMIVDGVQEERFQEEKEGESTSGIK